MIDITKLEIFNPVHRMPEPNQYFLLAIRSSETTTDFIPAVLTHRVTSDMFYKNCIVFLKTGRSIDEINEESCFGWAKMFKMTPSYLIEVTVKNFE